MLMPGNCFSSMAFLSILGNGCYFSRTHPPTQVSNITLGGCARLGSREKPGRLLINFGAVGNTFHPIFPSSPPHPVIPFNPVVTLHGKAKWFERFSHRFGCLQFNRPRLLSNFPWGLLKISYSGAPRAHRDSERIPCGT